MKTTDNKYFVMAIQAAGKNVWFNIYNVGSAKVASEILDFCMKLARLAIKLDSPLSKVNKTLDEQAEDMGGGAAIRKALYSTYHKCETLILHPEWF